MKEKHVNGVFTDIIGNPPRLNEFELFIRKGPEDPSDTLSKYTKKYQDMVTRWKSDFEKMALLEELILQLRAKENIKEIKFSIVREKYLYARTPFYRVNGTSKDIRVILGQKSQFEVETMDDIKDLYSDLPFMENTKRRLITAMDEIIVYNADRLKNLLP